MHSLYFFYVWIWCAFHILYYTISAFHILGISFGNYAYAAVSDAITEIDEINTSSDIGERIAEGCRVPGDAGNDVDMRDDAIATVVNEPPKHKGKGFFS